MFYAFLAMAPANPGAGSSSGGGMLMWLPMILIFAVMYFLILRPQAKRQKQTQAMLQSLEKGDKIVTTGGLHGVVLKVNEKENSLTIKIAETVKVDIERGAVARRVANENEST